MQIKDFLLYKSESKKIVMTTCYDYPHAKIIEDSDVDCVLVGDSVAMVMHGYDNTIHATMEMMSLHTQAVSKGLKNKYLISDMPFMSYRKSLSETMHNVQCLVQAGAQAIKLEGTDENKESINHIVRSGVPVMGHIGLTPQHVLSLGGFKVQYKDKSLWKKVITQAKLLETLGCFSIVLECMPSELAHEISCSLKIPTIGIGSGASTDGQVLVMHDMLGLQDDFKPKFLKRFSNAKVQFHKAFNDFAKEVRASKFPEDKHTY